MWTHCINPTSSPSIPTCMFPLHTLHYITLDIYVHVFATSLFCHFHKTNHILHFISLPHFLKFSTCDQMEIGNLDMPSKLRKRRLPTASSSSFPNDNNNVVLQLLLEKNVDSSPRNYEKCIISDLERSSCHINEQEGTMTLQKMFDKSVTTNVDRYRNNNNRSHPGRVYAPEVCFLIFISLSWSSLSYNVFICLSSS